MVILGIIFVAIVLASVYGARACRRHREIAPILRARKQKAEAFLDSINIFRMNSQNKEAFNVLRKKGAEEFVKHVFTHPENGRPLSYAEMRGFYG